MIRSDIIRSILPVIDDALVVCNIGLPSQELFLHGDRPANFYMLGTMGLASSIGLGLALAQKAPVVGIDGDGSVLTNLGTLPTIANNVASNFTLLIIDNGSYGSTGDQPTYAGQKTSLAAVARACGCNHVVECRAEDTARTLRDALDGGRMTVIVAKCDSGNVPVPVIDLDPAVIRHRFMQEVVRRNAE
ncbi:sulfopyruvate decarboxylase subunit beta [Defluviimonas sp. WL0002]|uniref:Sulfopyruvate decarboxylase subunit beta n=1 Tax=Albidovulum marisflavi TaxID=2984159 RepID=A0ABT2ZBI0_9RHOB|nr:sulfopyruvate decarboxylase subunit beta [Defluviimonas sp. WL0002]MCV2868428.1 sulfopyruvate decarboxylase subunit beta [Defluviimonas sp. WL0002]